MILDSMIVLIFYSSYIFEFSALLIKSNLDWVLGIWGEQKRSALILFLILSLILMGFIFSKFLPAVVKQILPSDDFSWTIIIFSKTSVKFAWSYHAATNVGRVWKYQRGNKNLCIEEEQTTQWPKEKVQKDRQGSTKDTYKTKDRVTRTPLITGGELRCSGGVSSSCSTSGTRC